MMTKGPDVEQTDRWVWRQMQTDSHASCGYWLALDPVGESWFVKFRDVYSSIRAVCFSRLAKRSGWISDEVKYIRLDAQGASIVGGHPEEIYAAQRYYDLHPRFACGVDCAASSLLVRYPTTVKDFAACDVENILAWPKSQVAACLFGACEEPEALFTSDHRIVLVDGEAMFHNSPSKIAGFAWLDSVEGQDRDDAENLVVLACGDLARLSAADIEYALIMPTSVEASLTQEVESIVREGIRIARDLCAS